MIATSAANALRAARKERYRWWKLHPKGVLRPSLRVLDPGTGATAAWLGAVSKSHGSRWTQAPPPIPLQVTYPETTTNDISKYRRYRPRPGPLERCSLGGGPRRRPISYTVCSPASTVKSPVLLVFTLPTSSHLHRICILKMVRVGVPDQGLLRSTGFAGPDSTNQGESDHVEWPFVYDKRSGDQREVDCVGSLTCNQSATDDGRKLKG